MRIHNHCPQHWCNVIFYMEFISEPTRYGTTLSVPVNCFYIKNINIKMAVEPEAERGLGLQGTVLKQLVFLPFVQYPPLPRVPDLSDPAYADPRAPELANSSNFYISSPPGDKS
jgi:hypothetical protein